MNVNQATAAAVNALKDHVGKLNGIDAKSLADLCGVTPRELRKVITAMRMDGVGVCGTPSTGYFLAESDVELERYCLKFLRLRAMHSLVVISRLTRVALPDLVGQMRLKT